MECGSLNQRDLCISEGAWHPVTRIHKGLNKLGRFLGPLLKKFPSIKQRSALPHVLVQLGNMM